MNRNRTDREIIEGIKQKDAEAEKYFYQKNKSICIQYALKTFFWKNPAGETLKCSLEDAEELYNDACILFIQNILKERIIQLDASISTYLISTMKYAWFNKARATKSTPEKVEPTPSEKTLESIRVNVRKAINQLDGKCREMMTYRYILGWEDYDDIAKITGKNNGDVVRNLISRCRKRFRELYVQMTNLSGV